MAFKSAGFWPITIVLVFLPLVWISYDIFNHQLGANPIQGLHIRLGDWALRFLWLTLSITPLQKITNWRGLANYRQLLGLFAFFYGSLHLLVYLVVDHALQWQMIITDIIESPYIWLGVLAYLILLLLAVTSPKSAKMRLGRNWKKVHRFIYLAAIAAIIHYFWQLKGNLAEPLFYLAIIFLLLLFRIMIWLKTKTNVLPE